MWLGPREPGHRKELRVCVGGEEVVGDLHAGVLAQLQMQEAKRYVEDSIAGGSKLLEGLSRTLMAMKGKGSKEGMWRAARAVRFVWGWAPTYAKLHQRGVTDSDKCPLCGEHDGRGHAVRECKHKELVKVRREVTVDMLKKVAGLGTVKKKRAKAQEQGGGWEIQTPASQVLPAHWIKAMHLVWGLGKEGTMRQWEGMGWPEFEAAVRHGCGAMLPGEEDKVVSCMGRIDKGTARGIVVLTVQGVGLRSGHFRESGLWSEEWQKELQRSGMRRGIVQDLVRVLHKGIARLEKEVWGKRAEVMEGMGLGAAKCSGSKDADWWRDPSTPEAPAPQSKEERDRLRRMGSLLSRGGQMNLYEAGCTSKTVQADEGGQPSVRGEGPASRAESEQQHSSTT
jgi:hypothetical protein